MLALYDCFMPETINICNKRGEDVGMMPYQIAMGTLYMPGKCQSVEFRRMVSFLFISL